MIGIPPPDNMPRDCWAAWYWEEVCEAVAAHERGEHDEGPIWSYEGCNPVQDLICGAIESGVSGHCIPVAGFSDPQPFHSLVAAYRTTPGGAAEREEAERRRVLDRPVPRRFRAGDPA